MPPTKLSGTSCEVFRTLAEVRLKEARTLLAAGAFDGAYYLAGYVVECALKAVIVKDIQAGVLPDKKYINDVYTHDLEDLLKLAGLADDLKKASDEIKVSWSVVNQWSEKRRYQTGVDQESAEALLNATDDANHGVLAWLKQRS